MAKFFPAAFGDRVALASWNGVRLLGPGGDLLWSSANPQPPGAFPTLRPVRVGRGALFMPAALTDIHGRAVILVTREPTRLGPYALRGLSAADGKTLWSTPTTDPRDVISYVGLPTVAGRYVYSVAVRRVSDSTAEMLLSALDVTRGTILWQTPLGSVAEQSEQMIRGRKNIRPEPLDYSSFAELSEPVVAGDLVVVSPNCGATIAVGRFDGRVRWVAVYRASDVPNARALRPPPLRWATARDAAAALRLRYKSTPVVCGDVVVAMPQDVPAIFAFDRAGGRRLWESDLQPAETFGLAGASGNMAILCGADAVYGLDAAGTGKRKWRYTPPADDAITGPAAVLGQTVIVPTTHGLVQLDAADGKERATYDVANWRRLWQTPGGRKAVDDAGASRAFGVPSP
jgi:outer membrane protein assembly factor BamB